MNETHGEKKVENGINDIGLSEKVMQSKLAHFLRNNGTLDSLKVEVFWFYLKMLVYSSWHAVAT